MSNLNYEDNKLLLNKLLNILNDTYILMSTYGVEEYNADKAYEIMYEHNLSDKDIKIMLNQIVNTNPQITFITQMQLNWSYNYPKLFGLKYKRGNSKNEYRDEINNYKKNNKIFDIYYKKKQIEEINMEKYYISFFYKNWEKVELLDTNHEWDDRLREVAKEILDNNYIKSRTRLKFMKIIIH